MTHYGRDESFQKSDVVSTISRPINNSAIYNYDDTIHITDSYANDGYGVMVSNASGEEYATDVDWAQCEMLDSGCYNQNYSLMDDYIADTKVPDSNVGGNVAFGDYWDQNMPAPNEYECGYEYGYEYDPTQQSTTEKELPLVTHNVQQCDSFARNIDSTEMMTMREGTYGRRDKRFGVRLPAAPATSASSSTVMANNLKYRMLPQAVAYQNVHNAQYNMNEHTGYAPNAGLIDERIGSFISLPAAAPLRMLPLSQQRPRSSQQLFKDGNNIVSDASGNQNIPYGLTASRTSTPEATGTSNYDVFCRMSRPYTSMLPLDYTDYGCHSDNLSTYSDTPPLSNAQHKIQQQRKISLMMAMTTASVIASGETRVPVSHHSAASQQRINNYPAPAAAPASASLAVSTSASMTCSETNINIHLQSPAACSGPSSVKGSMTNSITTNTATATATPTATATTTRKLPKRLPSPQYKSLLYTTNTTVPADISLPRTTQPLTFTNALSLPQSEKNYRSKQLPKLPMAKTKVTANANSVPISSFIADIKSPTSSPREAHTDVIMSSDSIVSRSLISSNMFTECVDNVVHLEEDQSFTIYSYGNQPSRDQSDVPSPIDASSIHHMDSPSDPLLFHSIQNANDKIQKNSSILTSTSPRKISVELESTSLSQGVSTASHQATTTSTTTTSSTISEYLKPYTLDSINFCTNDYNPTATTTTTSHTQVSYASGRDGSLGSLNFSLPSLESHMPHSFTTWTASPIYSETSLSRIATVHTVSPPPQSATKPRSRSEIIITPLSESTFTPDIVDIENSPQNVSTSISHNKVTTPVINNINNVFTTTVLAADSMPTKISTSITDNPPGPTPTQSYDEYMKQFELPELPPILDICSDYSSSQTVISETSKPHISTDTDIPIMISKLSANNATDISINTITRTSTIATSSYATESQKLHENQFDELKIRSCQFNQINNELDNENENEIKIASWLPFTAPIKNASLEIISSHSNLNLAPEISEGTSQAMPEYLSSNNVEASMRETAFDDSFYDSFNVDLSALTATIAQIESETCLDPVLKTNGNGAQNSVFIDANTNTLTDPQLQQTLGPGLGGYYKPHNQQPTVSQDVFLAPQKAKVTSAATSVLGGLSKGIKGGLDGVLSGVSSTMESTKQHPLNISNNSKKSFGFGLASKLVPSVGGLLSSSNKPGHEEEVIMPAPKITSSMPTTITTTSTSTDTVSGYAYEYEIAPVTPTLPTIEYNGGSPDIRYTNATFTHIKSSLDFDYHTDDIMSSDNSKMEALGFDDYDYSEYPAYQLSGEDLGVNRYVYNDSYKVEATISKNIDNSLNVTVDSIAFTQNQTPVTQTATDKSQNLVSAKSSIKKGSVSASSGMFGTIFGKAAAAVQSATQAVNHGASSVASAVAQKTVPSNKPGTIDLTASPNNIINSDPITIERGEYHKSMENNYSQLPINQESLSHQYPSTSDDYTNSNTQDMRYDMSVSVPITMPIVTSNDNIYYSDVNHPQHNDVVVAAAQKMLPTVPSAGSTGKKLPTINGKSGLLIKQQPTEIIDDESDEDVINDFMMRQSDKLLSEDPSYCIDSEQDDYYLDQEQTTPSSRRANDYYEHVTTSYDYREDFFNEEDEYKYLEQQSQLQQYQHQEQQQQQTIMLGQKRPSLDYIDDRQDDDDDFLDENYQSDEDDCGNYLDESSSGSVRVIDGRKPLGNSSCLLMATTNTNSTTTTTITSISLTEPVKVGLHTIPVANISPKLVGAHQQIKKQDSIIIEEGDSMLVDLDDDARVAAQISIDKEVDEDDQLADLMPIRTKSQKKKVLMRGETEEVVSGHMQILRKQQVTSKQRWHWAYNKIIMQLNYLYSPTSHLSVCFYAS